MGAQPTDHALGSIAVCVSEAMTNVVVHAYRDMDPPGQIEVEAELDGGSLTVRISDQGHGLEPRLDSPGLGLGLPLISQFADSSDIASPEQGGTEIIMRFDLREEGEAGP
jgi:serine/threonine-protein kinase RsbW/stage II sporulation protein AB (anti-sigma F factor)